MAQNEDIEYDADGNEISRILPSFPYGFHMDLPPDIRQLHNDIVDVLEGRTDITTFDPEYQQKIKDCYRFSATFKSSKTDYIVFRENNTMDLI